MRSVDCVFGAGSRFAGIGIRSGPGEAERRRYFEIACGSALEWAAIQDVLVVGKALDEDQSSERWNELDRMAAMLSHLWKRGYKVREARIRNLWKR